MVTGQQSPELTSGHNCVSGHMEAVVWQQPLVMEETHGCDQDKSVQDADRPGVDGHSSDQCTVNSQALDGIRDADAVRQALDKLVCAATDVHGGASRTLEQLQLYLRLHAIDQQNSEVVSWLQSVGKAVLSQYDTAARALLDIRKQQQDFEAALALARVQALRGDELKEEKTVVPALSDVVEHLSQGLHHSETLQRHTSDTLHCLIIIDQCYEWAWKVTRFVASLNEMSVSDVEAVLHNMDAFVVEHPAPSPHSFTELAETSERLDNSRLREQCICVTARCQEAQQLLDVHRLSLTRERDCASVEKSIIADLQPLTVCDSGTVPSGCMPASATCDIAARRLSSPVCSPPTVSLSPRNSLLVRDPMHGPMIARDSELIVGGSPLWMSNVVLRRRSYGGSAASSLPGYYGSAAYRQQCSENALEEQLFRDGLITEDMSHRVVTSLPRGVPGDVVNSESPKGKGAVLRKSSSLQRDSVASNPARNFSDASGSRMNRPRMGLFRKAVSCVIKRPNLADGRSVRELLAVPETQGVEVVGAGDEDSVIGSQSQGTVQCTDIPTSPSGDVLLNKCHSMISASSESLPSLPEEDEDMNGSGGHGQAMPWVSMVTPVSVISGRKPWSPVMAYNHLNTTGVGPTTNLTRFQSLSDLRLTEEDVKRRRTLMCVLSEMLQTERDYISSLKFVIDNYMSEFSRADLPQALRGKRHIVFGNWEKIYDFHSRYFIAELEQCELSPYQIAQCFLDHASEFYHYALFSKNKPASDALMSECGSVFFKRRQHELKDKLDLSSYLLKPVQRMGKYALLIKQVMKECSESEPDYANLQAALDMVRFQLRHGNDLLAMDSIKECDVNLQEQGMLLRQDEFVVYQGRKKCTRHVFLFEDLVVFSKTRHVSARHDDYIYRTSLKTSDIGLTENVDGTGLRFELWFRKLSSRDTYLLLAPSREVKNVWVKDISSLLWKQAIRNREQRLMVNAQMGVGNKPCLDLKPSKDNISDRAINMTKVRSRGSLAGLATQSQSVRVPAQSGNKRPQSMVSVMSSSSSGYSSLYSATAGLPVHKECVCEEGTDTCDLLDTTTPQPDDAESKSGLPDSSCTSPVVSVQTDAFTQTTLHRPKKRELALSAGDAATCTDNATADFF